MDHRVIMLKKHCQQQLPKVVELVCLNYSSTARCLAQDAALCCWLNATLRSLPRPSAQTVVLS